MTRLARLLPEPRLVEIDHVDLAVPAGVAWEAVRHGDLLRSPLARRLFATSPTDRSVVRLVDLAEPRVTGFRILGEEPGREVVLGAAGKLWLADTPFVELRSEADFVAFAEPGHAKIACALTVEPRGDKQSRLTLEVRATTTDDVAWPPLRSYYRRLAPGVRLVRRIVRDGLARELGSPAARENTRALVGDELLGDALGQATDTVDIAATPERIWPHLLAMARRRGGVAGELGDLSAARTADKPSEPPSGLTVGEALPTAAGSSETYEVLHVESARGLVLGGLWDLDEGSRVPFAGDRPKAHWQATWAFVLEPVEAGVTRVYARARVRCSGVTRLRDAFARPVHHLTELAQLRRLKERAEGRVAREGWRDVPEGVVGAAGITLDVLAPCPRHAPEVWGLDAKAAAEAFPGDELVPSPRWSFTDAIEIDAPRADVFPWIAQIGAERGGFYTPHWLENVAGSELPAVDELRAEWAARPGDELRLHPRLPALEIVAVETPSHLVAYGPPDPQAPLEERPWAAVSWVFVAQPLPDDRCRVVSRFRLSCSDDLASRYAYGPWVTESVGFVMDRHLLRAVKTRAEGGKRM